MFTECDGFQVDGMQEMGKQCPLQAQHVPAQDLITTAHGSQPLAVLDTIPRGHNGTRFHWDGALTWCDQQHTHAKLKALTHRPGKLVLRFHLLIQNILLPFSTFVRSLPCLAFSNRGWWPLASSPASLQDLSNRAPSPQGAVL